MQTGNNDTKTLKKKEFDQLVLLFFPSLQYILTSLIIPNFSRDIKLFSNLSFYQIFSLKLT